MQLLGSAFQAFQAPYPPPTCPAVPRKPLPSNLQQARCQAFAHAVSSTRILFLPFFAWPSVSPLSPRGSRLPTPGRGEAELGEPRLANSSCSIFIYNSKKNMLDASWRIHSRPGALLSSLQSMGQGSQAS